MTTTQLLQESRRTTAEDAIVVRGLRRSYSQSHTSLMPGCKTPEPFEAVKGIDLTVRHGEVLALLGTNGAGKTSTVELIEGGRAHRRHHRAARRPGRPLGLAGAALPHHRRWGAESDLIIHKQQERQRKHPFGSDPQF